MTISREVPQLPVELLESYTDVTIQLHHPVRGMTCIKQLNRLSIMLDHELALLEKIRYKQKNQHKAATWWRHVAGSQKSAQRLLEQLKTSFLSYLPAADNKQPELSAEALFSLSQNGLRILLLLDRTSSSHAKAAAAVQQLLRAALFMPLAMTLKALIARFHSIWVIFKEELTVFLGLLRSSPKRKSPLGLDLEEYMKTLPGELRRYWQVKPGDKVIRPHAPASIPVTSGKALEHALSGTPAPAVASDLTITRCFEAATTHSEPSDSLSDPYNQSKENGAPPEPPAEAEQTKTKIKKAKKRKRAAPEDDIDAIFAGF